MRLTVACPEAFMDDAQHLAMALAEGPADARTYRNPNWRDSQGNAYAVASFEAGASWLLSAKEALHRPAWDADADIDLGKARNAQDKILVWSRQDDVAPPAADPSRITLIAGLEGRAALQVLGLSVDAATPGNI
jgi:hypothetical protein